MSIMLVTYAHFFSPKIARAPSHVTNDGVKRDNSLPHQVHEESLHAASHTPTSIPQDGLFASALQGTEKEVILENEMMKVVLSTRGGTVKKVVLKQYLDHCNQPLTLLDEKSSAMGFQLTTHDAQVHTHTLFFETMAQDQYVAMSESAVATFTLPLGANCYIRHTFTLAGKGYQLLHTWEMVGLHPFLAKQPIQFVWQDFIRRVEKDIQTCRDRTTVNYYLVDKKFDHLKENINTHQVKEVDDAIRWVGIKQRFFTAGIVAQDSFVRGHLRITPTPESTTTVKAAQILLTLPDTNPDQDHQGQFLFYFGPNDYHILEQVTQGFSKNLSLGWPVVRWINCYLIIPLFTFLEQYISSHGLIIVLLVLLIKSLLLPLAYRSYIAMAKMRIVKPALDALQSRHGEDIVKMQQEQMQLYRSMGINPLSGCIPVLLQMPILLAMFNFFPNTIALRQKPFLWASDLSTYDAIIDLPFHIPAYGDHVSLFTLLMTISTIFYTWFNNNQLATPQGAMKWVSYLMPLTFMFILNSFPAGLSFYYFVSNVVTLGQQSLIKYMVDESKIAKQLNANKLNRSRKHMGKFQSYLKETIKGINTQGKKSDS